MRLGLTRPPVLSLIFLKIGPLAGSCGNASHVYGNGGRRIGRRLPQKWGASQMGCKVIEMHPTRTATGAAMKHSKKTPTHPILMFHYRCFDCLGGVFAAGGCCNLLQTVAICCRRSLTAEIVAECSQTVAICFKIQKSAHSASRWARPIS